MSNLSLRSALLAALLLTTAAPSGARADARYADVWGAVTADPYGELPHAKVTVGSFFRGFRNLLLEASFRTLDDDRDVLPWFRKLVHPNGICLAGTWHITEETPYTGYFREGSEGLIIARASTALSETERHEYRSFGFAGKIFPTTDVDHAAPLPTADFFTIEDLGGTRRNHWLDAVLTNDIIHISIRPSSVFQGALAFTVAHAFATADGTFDVTQTLVRQLYPIASLGEPAGTELVAPRWIRVTGSPDTPRVLRDDFRDELRMDHYPDGIILDVDVADDGTRLGPKAWRRVGYIHLTESVVSDGCDHRLHFQHPRYRHDLP